MNRCKSNASGNRFGLKSDSIGMVPNPDVPGTTPKNIESLFFE
jgi:hypothetical protein